ncbi:deoxyguanosinetriphosphate triphosphohydrolase [Neomegalonema perideroedes]|uniref:deoxyguanosinetriphosphate triphosphohydrolase n=1 Tax=Neomegalonema perideroedes TaxID=217219 RepID=UPI000375325D|nr:deoxyguanosinetriphosphate triphosphohydrolase [Neomegalonema perideroedes]
MTSSSSALQPFQAPRAPFAAFADPALGRLHPEPESAHRAPFARDRDRILHSEAFRRLKHKTQVFVDPHGDHIRTRLTHTLEVAQAARALARRLGLDEDLAEATALAHDLGHAPFGHAGEEALNEVMAPWGGFDHNAQAIRILTALERRYADFDGLNLHLTTLEAVAKHNGPLLKPGESLDALPWALREASKRIDFDPWRQSSAEAQCAAIADDLAYNTHDLEDGLRAEFFTLDDLKPLPLIGECLAEIDRLRPGLDPERRRHEALRRMFGRLMEDALRESLRRIAEAAPRTPEDVRAAPFPLVDFSPHIRRELKAIQQFLFKRVYRHYKVRRMAAKGQRALREAFDSFLADPLLLPEDWRGPETETTDSEAARARRAADYLAGMTDRFALEEHRRLTDPSFRA